MKRQVFYLIMTILMVGHTLRAQESASGKTGETGSANGLNRQTNTENRADISPDHPLHQQWQAAKNGANIASSAINEDQTESQQRSAPVAQWRYLSNLSADEKANAVLNFELPQSDGAFSAQARNIESLWNSGSHAAAIAQLQELQNRADAPDFGIAISWRSPKNVDLSALSAGPDVQISGVTPVQNHVLDFHDATGNMFSVVLYNDISLGKKRYTVNISTDGGATWAETFTYTPDGAGLNDIGAAVVDDYLYVAYVGDANQLEARSRRFFAGTGTVDNVYFFKVIHNSNVVVDDVVMSANQDFFNNRIYFTAILNNGTLLFYWATGSGGDPWNALATGITNASHGLDACTNQNYTDRFFLASYVATDGQLHVIMRGTGTAWTDVSIDPATANTGDETSIAAYANTFLVVWENADNDIRYRISYDEGASWLWGYVATGTELYSAPHATGRLNGGFQVSYAEEVGEPDDVYTTRREYASPPFEAATKINEVDIVTGTPTQVEILPDGGYGIAWIGGASEAWFDRIGGGPTEPDIDVNPTAMTVNENSPSAQQSPQNITFNTAQAVNLFEPAQLTDAPVEQREQTMLAAFMDEQTTANISYVKITASPEETDAMFLDLGSVSAHAQRTQLARRGYRNYTWFGALNDGQNGSVTFVVTGEDITGTIRAHGRLFAVRPIGGGYHALIEQDFGTMPEHPAEWQQIENREISREHLRDAGAYDPFADDGSVIDILVAYTPAAAAAAGNINALIQLSVDETNQAYANSSIFPTINLVHSYQTAYVESGNFVTDVDRFRIPGDGFMDEVHGLRNTHKADLCVLILNNPSFCGLASTILADETEAFCGVHWSCSTGNFSFAHELGHLQGCRHNPEADPTTTPFAYGHGLLDITNDFRTVMSYNDGTCPGGSCLRVQHFSNPDVNYFGNTTGSNATHDNARVIDETAFTMANFRTGGSSSPDVFTISNLGTATLNITGISTNQPWLSTADHPAPTFGINPGSGQSVRVVIDWTMLAAPATGDVIIASNDPDEPSVRVVITAIPDISITPDADISATPNNQTIGSSAGEQFSLAIRLGDSLAITAPDDFLGVSFNLEWDKPALVDYVSHTPGAMLGTSPIVLVTSFNDHIEAGLTRTDGIGQTGSGTVLNLTFELAQSLAADDTIRFRFASVAATQSNGDPLLLEPRDPIYVYVTACGAFVWPGDCNNDGITNATDVLFIGLRYNQTGPARASQGCAWEAKCATAWATPNAVYADANGNGTVNAADVLCIGLNYNKTHTTAASKPARSNETAIRNADAPVLNYQLFDLRNRPVDVARLQPGEEFYVAINSSKNSNLHGISASLDFSGSTAEIAIVDEFAQNGVQPSGEFGNDALALAHLDAEARQIDVAASRTDGQSAAISGELLRIRVRVVRSGKLDFSIVAAQAVAADGEAIAFATDADESAEAALTADAPIEFSANAFPNPFNPSTKIAFALPQSSKVELTIYNALGQQVARLIDGKEFQPGKHSIQWNAASLPSGMYFYVIKTPYFQHTAKMMLLK